MRSLVVSLGAVAFTMLLFGCTNVQPGSNIVAPDLALDEGFFFCQIQPNVINPHSCAGDTGECHAGAAPPTLYRAAELAPPPACEDTDGDGLLDNPTEPVPQSYRDNLTNVRFEVRGDPLSSQLYRRPTRLDPHLPELFTTDDEEAQLLFKWISDGGS